MGGRGGGSGRGGGAGGAKPQTDADVQIAQMNDIYNENAKQFNANLQATTNAQAKSQAQSVQAFNKWDKQRQQIDTLQQQSLQAISNGNLALANKLSAKAQKLFYEIPQQYRGVD